MTWGLPSIVNAVSAGTKEHFNTIQYLAGSVSPSALDYNVEIAYELS